MKRLLDTNVWIALTVEAHAHHRTARHWYDTESLNAGDLLFCRATETSLLRLLTNARVMNSCSLAPLTNQRAIAALETLYRDPAVGHAVEPPATRETWLQLAAIPLASPHVWMDAYLAAFSFSLGAQFVTFDAAFSRYVSEGLDVRILSQS